MAELSAIKLNAESQILLERPLLGVPYELSRKKFATARREVDREQSFLTKTLSSASTTSDPVSALDTLISRMANLKRKLEVLQAEETELQEQSKARIEHLRALERIPTVMDVKYDEWSRTRLNRLLVDYMLRSGYVESARQLAAEKGIEKLVDVGSMVECLRIEKSLKEGRTAEALAWCAEHGKDLKKLNIHLVFELRLSQYIMLVREGKLNEALMHAKKHFYTPPNEKYRAVVMKAAAMLVLRQDVQVEPYLTWYSPERNHDIAAMFVETHHTIFGLPKRPLLHIALSAGLSALKTPACHSKHTSSSGNASSAASTLCPICSKELHELARNVPYAHHTKSHVDPDPVVLPHGRIYGREFLRQANEKLGTEKGMVRDPTELDKLCREEDVKKVFIS
ncbi:hypothetical protein EJ05DRAFT_512630 [Pseudovirgaria hyperparasitica]|uniref:Protein FYV10 n=1 Tax=Pseudovirgaria hyperparasitica TaxID=470096 RepID=A0A6A6W397_9PEZI|nr:uncharacterized protein EJ05DRAFT_512630 [Pseudovirgaria hyperparasitica]KAF2756067.1 hypothetical protein EJ05DRAFT_512630 [Pseudovirgaria hyperparasitica]